MPTTRSMTKNQAAPELAVKASAQQESTGPPEYTGPPEPFSKCNFVNTEINHDLNPPIDTAMNQSTNFRNVSSRYLDAQTQDGKKGCNNFTEINNEFYNDDNIVQKVFESNIKELRQRGKDEEIEVSVLVDIDDNKNSSRINAKIRKYYKEYNKTLINLFPEKDHMFFIIDTGDNFVQTLKSLTLDLDGSPAPNIHVIHSALTLGDSAPKTLPDSKNYNSNNRTVNLYSWYYHKKILVPKDDRLFMSGFEVTTSKYQQTPGWKMRQDWKEDPRNPNKHVYQTFDSKCDNSKPVVKSYLNKNIKNLESNIREASLNMQKKRSGDYLQIWFAKEFPRLIAAQSGQADFVFVRGPPEIENATLPVPGIRPGTEEAWYKKRTYFITGDWPAFSYAAYNRINAIMIFKHPIENAQSCTIRVQF